MRAASGRVLHKEKRTHHFWWARLQHLLSVLMVRETGLNLRYNVTHVIFIRQMELNWPPRDYSFSVQRGYQRVVSVATKLQQIVSGLVSFRQKTFRNSPAFLDHTRQKRTYIRISGPKGRRFKSCHLDHAKALEIITISRAFILSRYTQKYTLSAQLPINVSNSAVHSVSPSIPAAKLSQDGRDFCVQGRFFHRFML